MAQVSEGLFVELKLIANEWTQGIKDAQKDAKELEKSFKPLKDAAMDLGAPMAAAGAAIVASLGAAVKVTADYGDMLNDARQKTGLTVESLAKLKFAADQSGSSFDGLQTGLKFLNKNMELSTTTGKAQAAAFAALGISVKDTTGAMKPTETVLREVSDRFSTMADGSAKTTIAMNIFGKAGADLIPTLNAGSAGLDEMGAAATRAGLVIGGDAAAAGDVFNDKVVELEASIKGMTLTVGAVLLPTIVQVVSAIVTVVQAVKDWTAAHPELVKGVAALGIALTGAGGLLVGLAGALTILPGLTAAFTLLTGPIGLTVAAITALGAAFVAFPQFRGAVITVLKDVIEAVAALASELGSLGKALMEIASGEFKKAFDTIRSSGTKALDDATWAADKFDSGITTVKTTIAGLTTGFQKLDPPMAKTAATFTAIQAAVDKLTPAQQGLKTTMETVTNAAMYWNKQLDDSNRLLAAADRAALLAIPSNNLLAQATQEWANTLQNVNGQLRDLPLNAQDAQNKLLMLKPPKIDIGPTAEEIAAGQKRYEDLFNSIEDTASRTFTAIWHDGEFKFGEMGKTVLGIFETLANKILSTMTAQLLEPLVANITSKLGGLLKNIPGLGGVFGSVAGVGSSAAGAAGSAAGSVGGVAGGVGSTGLSLASGGLIAAGAAVGGILGGVLGNDRGAQRETAFNTGATHIVLKDTLEQVLWPQFNLINAIAQSPIWSTWADELGYWATQIADVTAQWGANIVSAVAGIPAWGATAIATPTKTTTTTSTPPITIAPDVIPSRYYGGQAVDTFNLLGGLNQPTLSGYGDAGLGTFNLFGGSIPQYAMGTASVPRTGLAIVHKGESISPAGSGRNVTVNISIGSWLGDKNGIDQLTRRIANELNNFVQFGGGRLLATDVR